MTNYQLGDRLELDVVGLKKNSAGAEFLLVRDEERTYPVYNLIKCQHESQPDKIYVAVYSIDAFGKVKFRQDLKRVLEDHYSVDSLAPFNVTDIKDDTNGHPYYLLEDDFAEHRFYIRGEQKYQIGDSCILEVKGVDDKGFLLLAEHQTVEISQPAAAPAAPAAKPANVVISNTVSYGPESTTVEYKSSIVYDPKTSLPDIAAQTANIITELAALMNTDGGKLIIGVNDKTQVVTGIERDYPHLNDDDQDSFSYQQNTDGYEQKLRHVLNYLCPTLAGSLVEFKFKSKNGHDYLVIEVKRADRPIWVRAQGAQGSFLYIRQGNRRKTIYGEELTNFIFRRMKESVDAMAGGAQAVAQLDTEKLEEILRKIINEKKQQDVKLPPAPQKEIDYWVVWEADGPWRRQNEKAASCFMQLPFYRGLSNPTLVFCYDNTRVVTMEWKKVRYKVNLNKVQPSLWNKDLKPTHIFLADINDLLLIRSLDHNGVEAIKLHALTDFSPVEKGGAKGSPVLPGNTSVKQYAMLDAMHLHAVSGLVCTKEDRSKTTGTPVNTASDVLAKQIAYAEELLKTM